MDGGAEPERDPGHFGDYTALDESTRTRADGTVGRPGTVAAQGVLDLVTDATRWRGTLARNLLTAASTDAALESWGESIRSDSRIAQSIYETAFRCDLAGQLMVREIEAPEALPNKRAIVLASRAPGDAFLQMPFADALAFFRDKRLISQDEFDALSDKYKRGGFAAVNLASDYLKERARSAIERSLAEGRTLDDTIRLIRDAEDVHLGLGISPVSHDYLDNVVRTNVAVAYGAGRYRAMTHPDVIAARPWWQYMAVGDSRTRAEHLAINGTVVEADSEEARRIAPPNGFRCFPADTLVQGVFEIGLRLPYSGDLLEIRTKSGRRLRVTPNHPVATLAGFVPASSIREGSQLVAYMDGVERNGLPLPVAAPNDEQAPARIDDVFAALEKAGTRLLVESAGHDLDGDAAFGDGTIEIVGTERKLRLDVHKEVARDVDDVRFVDADEVALGPGDVRSGGTGERLPANCLPGATALTLDERSTLFDLAPLQQLRCGPASNLDASRSKTADDRAAVDTEFVRELLARSSGDVFLDDVVSVQREFFVGHVYDLQSQNGWIVADGLLTSNCRCGMRTLSADDVRRLGLIPFDGRTTLEPDEGFDGPPSVLEVA